LERNYAIDFIKFFAILAVVIIHTFPRDHQLGYFALDNLSRFAVPYFFAASGYLFGIKIRKNPESLNYFKKYSIKILKIYVSWLLFYICYDVLRISASDGNLTQGLFRYFDDLTALNLLYYGQGTSGYQLWFVISLAWSISTLYLFYKMKQLNLLVIIGLFLNVAGLFGQSYSFFIELPVTSRDALFIGLFYTTLGFCFSHPKSVRYSRSFSMETSALLIVFFLILQVIEGYWLEKILSAKHGEYFISTIPLTVFLFIFTIQNPQLGKGLWVSKIGAHSLGIYAVHVFVIDLVDMLLSNLGLGHVSQNLIWNIIDAFLVFSISYIAYHLIQKAKTRVSKWWHGGKVVT